MLIWLGKKKQPATPHSAAGAAHTTAMKKLAYFFKKFFWLGLLGAALYPLLEIAFRGHSHWSMALAGGLCLLLLGLLQRRLAKSRLHVRCLAGMAAITFVELAVGCVVNLYLGLNVWDYGHIPGNIGGQICPLFCALWFLLCIPVFKALSTIKNL